MLTYSDLFLFLFYCNYIN